ncbi:MAG: hypothetical protein AAGH76_06885 [Pseudomonadota bacterium]
MPDDIVDSAIGRLFRFALSIVKDFVFDIVCYAVGWVTLRMITFGRHPAVGLGDGMRHDVDDESWVSIVGIIVIAAGAYALYRLSQ